jgi:para-aminobenzoate synthetase component 1
VRNKFIYKVKDFDKLVNKLLVFSKSSKYSCLLHSNVSKKKLPTKYSNFKAIFAFDSISNISSNHNSFNKLKKIHQQEKDWLFGYLSYDLKNESYNLTSNKKDNIKSDNISFFIPKYVFLIKDTFLYIESFESKKDIDILYNEIMNQCLLVDNNETVIFKSRESKDMYLEKIKKIKHHIQIGDIYEMNYCQEFYSNNVDVSPQELFYKMIKITESPFASFLNIESTSVICLSPERYLLKDGNHIISQPIKGTSKRSTNDNEDKILIKNLQSSQKNISENIMIVDLVRNDLSQTALNSSVKVDKLCGVYTFNNIHQMISTISSEVHPSTHFTEVLETTFPMGSMTGAPKIKAMSLIDEYECVNRGVFSGSIGYITPVGDFDFNVVIRSLIYNNKTKYLSVSVGGAITCNSEPHEEYEECLVKIKPIFESLKHSLDD